MMTFPTYGKIKVMFQTTNQVMLMVIFSCIVLPVAAVATLAARSRERKESVTMGWMAP